MVADENWLAELLYRSWWVLLLRGVIAIGFGVMAWTLPTVSLTVLVLIFGVYVMTDGILGVWTAILGRKEREHWWALLIWGLAGIGIGVLTFLAPHITAVILLFYIAIWAVITGILEIVIAIRLRNEITGEWLLVLGGLASVVFGVILMARPLVGALAVLWLIGTYAVIFGIILVTLAFRSRAFVKRLARA